MHADLVGAAGFGVALHEGFSLAGLEHAVVGERLPTPLHDRHFLTVDGMPADGRLDFAVGHAGDAIGQGEVGFFDMARGELLGERAVGLFGFRHDETAGGFLVEAVDDARSLRASDDLDARAVVEEPIGEGAFAVARAGVDDEPGGFVEDEEVFILEKNAQRNLLRGEGGGGGFPGNFQNHGVALAQDERGFGRGAIHESASITNKALQAGPRKIGAKRPQKPIKALAGPGRSGKGFEAVGRWIGHLVGQDSATGRLR